MDQLKYQMIIQWSNEDNCFLVALPDFPGQYWRTHKDTSGESNSPAWDVRGDTYEEAVANGKEALEYQIFSYEQDGEPLPEPTIANVT